MTRAKVVDGRDNEGQEDEDKKELCCDQEKDLRVMRQERISRVRGSNVWVKHKATNIATEPGIANSAHLHLLQWISQ